MQFSGNYMEENQSYDKLIFEVGSKRPKDNTRVKYICITKTCVNNSFQLKSKCYLTLNLLILYI